MEGFLVSAATGALRPVLWKLAAVMGDEYKRFKGVRGQIKFLAGELTAMHAFLLKMSEVEDPDAQDRAWMDEVRELSYDLDDSLDEFMLRDDDDDKDTKPDGFIDKIKSLLEKTRSRRGIAKAIQDLKKQVVVVGERHARYKIGEAVSRTRTAAVDPRALAIFVDMSKLVGMDVPKQEVIELFTEEPESGCESTPRCPKVVSIVGLGGLGKTTLANQVYEELKRESECRAFISVSRSPDTMKILRTILSSVSGKDYASTEAADEQQLIIKISDFLKDKRYFIVVDDIWNVEIWDTVKCAFPKTSFVSRIITTTRINDVAQSCCSSSGDHIYNIRPLDMVHSRQLFHKRLFNSKEKCPPYLENVSDQILQRCAGLPLAIIAISGLLANKPTTMYQWDQVRNSIGCGLERNSTIDRMVKILSLSYFDLPPHLKTCLLHLSIFPEDSTIEKQDIINRWIAEGFIREELGYTVDEVGEMSFNELINRSLIQPVRTGSFTNEVKSCCIHDTILDFIISKSIEENFVTFVGVPNLTIGTQRKVRRLSLQVGKQGNYVLPKSLLWSQVRSLNVFRHFEEIPSLEKFRRRVLGFQGIRRLRSNHLANIGRLFQLRYLNLRNTNVSDLPEQIELLQCLRMLDLRHTSVHELPAAIVRLGNLVHLFTSCDVKYPDGIAKMQALQTLKQIGMSLQSSSFFQELCQLKNRRKLRLKLAYDPAEFTKKHMKVIASSIFQLSTLSLDSLKISCDEEKQIDFSLDEIDLSLDELDFSLDDSFLLEQCCTAPRSLRELIISVTILHVPDWVGSLVNLQRLLLGVKEFRQEDLCTLGGLPSLSFLVLTVEGEAEPTGMLTVSGADGFPCLKAFFFFVDERGMDLMFVQGSMPKLEALFIGFNAAKTESLSSGVFDLGIENLPCLEYLACTLNCASKSSDGDVQAARDAMERAASAHANHPRLQIQITEYD